MNEIQNYESSRLDWTELTDLLALGTRLAKFMLKAEYAIKAKAEIKLTKRSELATVSLAYYECIFQA